MAEEDLPQNRRPAPQLQPVPSWPTPEKSDLLFYVEKAGIMPGNKPDNWNYDDPYNGPNAHKYPNHKLIYVSPETATTWSRWFYMADRANQDDYNYEFTTGEQLVRTYVVKRSLYFARNAVEAAAVSPVAPDEFTVPVVATPDIKFEKFGFADDTLGRTETELDSLYVVVKRKFVEPVVVQIQYNDAMARDVTTVRRLIPKGTVIAASVAGITREREPGNIFHDIEVISTIGTVTFPGGTLTITLPGFPIQLDSIPTDVPFQFPPLLRSVTIVAAWVTAQSDSAAPSYDEAYYFDFDLVKPTIGPYEARVLRFITDDPDSLRSIYPIDKIVTVNETIGITRGWAIASSLGNSTFAEARQLEVPSSIHGDITIENAETLSVGQNKNFLPATPGFDRFQALTTMVVGYESKQTPHGTYMVEITELNVTGVYSGETVPFGGSGGSTGAGNPPTPVNPPLLPTAVMAADNTSISGVTSPFTQVTVKKGSATYGQVLSDENGAYVLPLSEVFTDVVTFVVKARRSGVASGNTPVLTFDLAPDSPDAVISTDLTTVSGVTEPNAVILILKNAVPQVVTATVIPDRLQVETATFVIPANITLAGDAEITFDSVLTGNVVVLFAVALYDTPAMVAVKAAAALVGNATIDADYAATSSGANLIVTARVAAANDVTLNVAIDNDTCTGITPAASSTDTTAGGGPVTVLTDGNAKITVTSGIAAISPVVVRFPVQTGDDPSDVAQKGAAALVLSTVNDDYVPSNATNTIILTARVAAINDATLNVAIDNDTCTGLIAAPTSVTTMPGGTPFTTTANASGAYSYAFSPALTSGDVLTVAASDSGGTSAPTLVEASATPPTLSTAAFPADIFDTIEGTASVASKVIAYLEDTPIGNAITDGSGDFSITLATPLTHGETVRVVAVEAGNEDVRSSIIVIEANTLEGLEQPVFEPVSFGYVGTTGFPSYTVSFAVVVADNATNIAQKAVTALIASAVNTNYIPTRVGTDVVLTARTGVPYRRWLNVVVDNNACTGITPDPVSTSTGSGVVPQVETAGVTGTIATGTTAKVTVTLGPIAVVIDLADEVGTEFFATLYSNGQYNFSLPGVAGERYAVFYRYPEGDSDPVYVYAVITPLPALRIWPMVYRTANAASLAAVSGSYATMSGVREPFRSGYVQFVEERSITGRTGIVYLYVPFYAVGMTVNIQFPGQGTSEINDTPSAPATGDDVRYTISTGGDPPLLVLVTVTHPDGRQVTTSFDRGTAFSFMVYDLSI